MSKSALIVFGKNPASGKVKTRIAVDVGEDVAVALYEAFLVDTLVRCSQLSMSTHLYLAPSSGPVAPSIAPFDGNQFRQRGEGLGARMANAFSDSFEAGFDRVVIIGSDHPTLPLVRIEEAFASLSDPETVAIGPSADGGYYLVGLSAPAQALFDGMSYSHSRVLEHTLSRASVIGLTTLLLEPWYDVDTIDDVARLAQDVEENPHLCPNTRSILISAGLIENTSSPQGSASEKAYFSAPPQNYEHGPE